MKQDYHSAYGLPLAGIDHEFMRFLQWRRKEPKPKDKGQGHAAAV